MMVKSFKCFISLFLFVFLVICTQNAYAAYCNPWPDAQENCFIQGGYQKVEIWQPEEGSNFSSDFVAKHEKPVSAINRAIDTDFDLNCVSEDESDFTCLWCSGTMISENMYLTAAHCVEDADYPFNISEYLVTSNWVIDFDYQYIGGTDTLRQRTHYGIDEIVERGRTDIDDPNGLDYAILKINNYTNNYDISAGIRAGFTRVEGDPSLVDESNEILIIQYPALYGELVDSGIISDILDNGKMLQYSNNTYTFNGSSGSGVLGLNGKLVGVHSKTSNKGVNIIKIIEKSVLLKSDYDNDGSLFYLDNCPETPNDNQSDFNNDGIGDACQDSDGDTLLDEDDNCPAVSNGPNDEIGNQKDWNNDGMGDACQDYDNDTVLDYQDICPATDNLYIYSTDDWNNDGIGDECDRDGDGLDDMVDPQVFYSVGRYMPTERNCTELTGGADFRRFECTRGEYIQLLGNVGLKDTEDYEGDNIIETFNSKFSCYCGVSDVQHDLCLPNNACGSDHSRPNVIGTTGNMTWKTISAIPNYELKPTETPPVIAAQSNNTPVYIDDDGVAWINGEEGISNKEKFGLLESGITRAKFVYLWDARTDLSIESDLPLYTTLNCDEATIGQAVPNCGLDYPLTKASFGPAKVGPTTGYRPDPADSSKSKIDFSFFENYHQTTGSKDTIKYAQGLYETIPLWIKKSFGILWRDNTNKLSDAYWQHLRDTIGIPPWWLSGPGNLYEPIRDSILMPGNILRTALEDDILKGSRQGLPETYQTTITLDGHSSMAVYSRSAANTYTLSFLDESDGFGISKSVSNGRDYRQAPVAAMNGSLYLAGNMTNMGVYSYGNTTSAGLTDNYLFQPVFGRIVKSVTAGYSHETLPDLRMTDARFLNLFVINETLYLFAENNTGLLSIDKFVNGAWIPITTMQYPARFSLSSMNVIEGVLMFTAPYSSSGSALYSFSESNGIEQKATIPASYSPMMKVYSNNGSVKIALLDGFESGTVRSFDVAANGVVTEEYIAFENTNFNFAVAENFCLNETDDLLNAGTFIGSACLPFTHPWYKQYSIGTTVYSVAGKGNRLYVGTGTAIKVYDISDPNALVLKSTFTTNKTVYDLEVADGDIMYAATSGGLYKLNTVNPNTLTSLQFYSTPYNYQYRIQLYNDNLYVGDDNGINIRSTTNFARLAYVNIGSTMDFAIANGELAMYWDDFWSSGIDIRDAATLTRKAWDYPYCSTGELTTDHGAFYLSCDGYEYRFVGLPNTYLDFFELDGDMREMQENYLYNGWVYIPDGNKVKLSTSNTVPSICGNGIIEPGEFCDGNTEECGLLDPNEWDSGTAYCNSTCTAWDTGDCYWSGC